MKPPTRLILGALVPLFFSACSDAPADGAFTDAPAIPFSAAEVSGTTRHLVPTSDGGVVALGTFVLDGRETSVLRLDAAAGLVAGSDGAVFDAPSLNGVALATDASGDVFAAGDFTHYGETPSTGIIRLDPRGGVAATNADPAFAVVHALATARDGSGAVFILASATGESPTVSRLNGDLTVDPAFEPPVLPEHDTHGVLLGDRQGGVYVMLPAATPPGKFALRLDASGASVADLAQPVYVEKFFGLAEATDGTGDLLVRGYFAYRSTKTPGIERLDATTGAVVATFVHDAEVPRSNVGVSFFGAEDGSGDLWAWSISLLLSGGGSGQDCLQRMSATGTVLGALHDPNLSAAAPAQDGGVWVARRDGAASSRPRIERYSKALELLTP